jgi:putative transposase
LCGENPAGADRASAGAVPAEVKELVLKSVDDTVAAGFTHTWACALWQVSDSRVHRWRARCRDTATLVDQAPGGHPVHGLLPEGIATILEVTERWGAIDSSHRKLAHRGSYQVWCGCRQPRSGAC